MSLEITRRIKCNLHGTVDISPLEDLVIGHEYFQRLRRIKQLAFLHLAFPGATHTRFEHSIGVLHLANQAWQKLYLNQKRFANLAANIANFVTLEKKSYQHIGSLAYTFPVIDQIFESDYILQTFRLAALLHDVGHPPFSHSGEKLLPTYAQILNANQNNIPNYIKTFLEKRIKSLSQKGKDYHQTKVKHEVLTILLTDKILNDIYQQNPNIKLYIEPKDVNSIICPDIEPSKTSPIISLGINKVLQELMSGEFDIDRMDYLLRDSKECGVLYGIVGAERILDSLCVYLNTEDKSLHLAINNSGLDAFEDYLRARLSMYKQVYFHKTGSAAEAMMIKLCKILKNWSLPANIEKYAQYDEYNINTNLITIAKESLPSTEFERFEKLLKDLLYNRKLWKIIAEFDNNTSLEIMEQQQKRFDAIINYLNKNNIDYEIISSTNLLTDLLSTDTKFKNNKSYLKLIKKDEFLIPRLVPIENYANFLNENTKVFITRIYSPQRINLQLHEIL